MSQATTAILLAVLNLIQVIALAAIAAWLRVALSRRRRIGDSEKTRK